MGLGKVVLVEGFELGKFVFTGCMLGRKKIVDSVDVPLVKVCAGSCKEKGVDSSSSESGKFFMIFLISLFFEYSGYIFNKFKICSKVVHSLAF